MSVIIDTFYVKDCGYYQVYYTGSQFYFTLIPCYEILKKHYGQSALFYVDDETTDDVNYNKQPFQTIQRVINAMIGYVKQSKWSKEFQRPITYFYFHSSTERKDKIYDYYAKKVVAMLGDEWQYSNQNNGFYFWKVQPK